MINIKGMAWLGHRQNFHLWFPHLVLYRKDNTDSLKGEDCGAEEDWKACRGCEPGNSVSGGQFGVEYVEENDCQSNKLQDVGQHGARREIFEVLDAADEDDWEDEEPDVDSVAPAGRQVSLHDLRKLRKYLIVLFRRDPTGRMF